MKKFLIKGGLFSLLVLLIANGLALGILKIHTKSKLYKPSFIANMVAEKKFDYIFLGSSMGLTSINTILLDELTDMNGLNASMDDTSLATHYLMLKHFVESGGETNRCYVAISPSDISNNQPSYSTNDYRFLPFIHNQYVYEEIKNREKGINPLKATYWQPFIGTTYYNLELGASAIQAFLKPSKRNRFDEKGNYSYPVAGNPPSNKLSESELEWRNPFIDKIEKLAKENNIELIYYQPPIYNLQVINNDSAKKLINHSNQLKSPDLFYDRIHVNKHGREEITRILAAELQ